MKNKEWEDRAETDGLYAIACAIIELSDNVDRLGLNRNTTTECMGTLERLVLAIEDLCDKKC